MAARRRKNPLYFPKKRPTQARATATFDAIVTAGAQLLGTRGYVALTTNHIAQTAGVSVGSLYEYFPGKEAVVAEVVRKCVAEVLYELQGAFAKALEMGQPADGMRFLIHQMFEIVGKRKGVVRSLWLDVPFTRELDEIRVLPEALSSLTRLSVPSATNPLVAAKPEASAYLLTVMFANAFVESVTLRPRHLSSDVLEETLTGMALQLVFADGLNSA